MALSCFSCRYKSQNRAFFRQMRAGTLGLDRWFCLGCKPFPKAKLGFSALAASGFFALLGWLLVAASPGLEPLGYGLLAGGALIFTGPFTLVVHEMGHAAAAALFGRRVYQISIGSGVPFKTIKISHTLFVIGRDMGVGYVIELPVKEQNRLASMLILAAGATANLAVAVLLMNLADYVSVRSGVAAAFIAGSILSNLITAALALLPGHHTRDGKMRPSDGQQMLKLLGPKGAPVDWQLHHTAFKGGVLLQAKLWNEAETHYRDAFARYPDQPGFLGALMHVLGVSKGYAAAMSCVDENDAFLRQEGELSAAMSPIWSHAWGMAAWAHIRAPRGNLSSADTFLQKAIEADPDSPYPRAVLGAILARSGEPSNGLAVIMANLRELGSPGDKLEFCDFILAENLESEDLKASDFRSYAAHLRALA